MSARKLATAAVWLAVFSGLVFLPGALNRWVFPKEVVLLAACVIASRLLPTGRLPRWLVIAIGVGAALLLATALQSDAPLMQVLGRWPRYEGVITLVVYVAALWMGARLLGPGADAPRREQLRAAVAAASIILGAVSVMEAAGLAPIPTTSSRPGALLGNATDQGILAVMFFAVLVVPLVRTWVSAPALANVKSPKGGRSPDRHAAPEVRWLPLIGAVAALVTLVISASRGALLGLGVVVIGLVALEWLRRRTLRASGLVVVPMPRRTLALTAASAVLVLAVIVAAFPLLALRTVGLTPLSASTINDRVLMYDAAVRLVGQSPVWGAGPSGFVDAVAPLLGRDWYATVGADTVLTSPHNWLLQALSAGGAGLGILAIGIAVAGLVIGIRRWQGALAAPATQGRADLLEGAGIAMLGYGVALLTHFTTPGTTMFAAVLLGSILSVPARTVASTVMRELASWARTVAIAVVFVIIAAYAWSEVALQQGVSAAAAGNVEAADAAFQSSLAVRPWDADTASIAAQSLAQAADAQAPGAAALAVSYALRALDATPSSVPAAKALAVGQQYSGELAGAELTLNNLRQLVPFDAGVAQRLGGVLLLRGNVEGAERELILATELDPIDPAPWVTLEFLYQQTGDAAAAAGARAMADRLTAM